MKLNSGIEYRGVLACLDGYLNIAMEQTEEFENGQLKARYGDCMIRGNNGTRARERPLLSFLHYAESISPVSTMLQLCTSPRRKPRNDSLFNNQYVNIDPSSQGEIHLSVLPSWFLFSVRLLLSLNHAISATLE